MIANKSKIEADSTVIGASGAPILGKTTTSDNTYDKTEQAKQINSSLPPFIANNIRTTHYEIGPGGSPPPTEN
jgi:hypothetical protein